MQASYRSRISKEIKQLAPQANIFRICAGEAIEVESMEVEGSGRVSWGVDCGDMCRRGYRSRIYRSRSLGKAVLVIGLWGYVQARL